MNVEGYKETPSLISECNYLLTIIIIIISFYISPFKTPQGHVKTLEVCRLKTDLFILRINSLEVISNYCVNVTA